MGGRTTYAQFSPSGWFLAGLPFLSWLLAKKKTMPVEVFPKATSQFVKVVLFSAICFLIILFAFSVVLFDFRMHVSNTFRCAGRDFRAKKWSESQFPHSTTISLQFPFSLDGIQFFRTPYSIETVNESPVVNFGKRIRFVVFHINPAAGCKN